ncbi:MAG: FAD binding domain-containing protein [Gemmatimonadetes bacterium]|nr:FAD binding domain-containing protein [Gemmatimonadota bacterium]
MTGFAYHRPSSLDDALAALAERGSLPIGGGSDLLAAVEEGRTAPTRVVELEHIPELATITVQSDGGVRIGAGVRIASLAEAPELAAFPVLRAACSAVGSPALRAMGTLGGNLGQRQRCWYFRSGVGCFKNGGTGCAAVDGEHVYHAILASGTCHAAHPSDPAVALLALDARVEVRSIRGSRMLDIAALYEGAADNARSETVLAKDEVIVAVHLGAAARDGAQHWEKLTQRRAFDLALVSCAGVRHTDGSVRIALGGVAAGPWRAPHSVEEDIASGGLDDESIEALAARAMYDATPLAGNAYKVQMAEAAIRRAARAISI